MLQLFTPKLLQYCPASHLITSFVEIKEHMKYTSPYLTNGSVRLRCKGWKYYYPFGSPNARIRPSCQWQWSTYCLFLCLTIMALWLNELSKMESKQVPSVQWHLRIWSNFSKFSSKRSFPKHSYSDKQRSLPTLVVILVIRNPQSLGTKHTKCLTPELNPKIWVLKFQ